MHSHSIFLRNPARLALMIFWGAALLLTGITASHAISPVNLSPRRVQANSAPATATNRLEIVVNSFRFEHVGGADLSGQQSINSGHGPDLAFSQTIVSELGGNFYAPPTHIIPVESDRVSGPGLLQVNFIPLSPQDSSNRPPSGQEASPQIAGMGTRQLLIVMAYAPIYGHDALVFQGWVYDQSAQFTTQVLDAVFPAPSRDATAHQPRGPPKIEIVSDDGTGGHRAAAKALQEALNQNHVPAQILEFYDQSSGKHRKLRDILTGIRLLLPSLARYVFSQSMKPKPDWIIRLYKYISLKLTYWSLLGHQNKILKAQPDIVVSVHEFTNYLAEILKKAGLLKVPVYSIVTDYLAPRTWYSSHIDRYYVASEEVRRDLMRYGVPAHRIMVMGIPVSPKITDPKPYSQERMKIRLGLKPNLPAILLMGGSLGLQKYGALLETFAHTLKDVQVVVFCGRNESLRKKLQDLARKLGISDLVRVVGFQANMPDWYYAADAVVTKPGGLTTSEVLAAGKPLILMSPLPGMEEAQAKRLVKAGVALYRENPQEVAELVQKVLTEPSLRQGLREASLSLAPPGSARRIAEDIVRSLN